MYWKSKQKGTNRQRENLNESLTTEVNLLINLLTVKYWRFDFMHDLFHRNSTFAYRWEVIKLGHNTEGDGKKASGLRMIKWVSWRRGGIFCVEGVTEISINLRNNRESKNWGISKALTSIYILSQVYTGHMPFHIQNCCGGFFSPHLVQFTLKEKQWHFTKVVQQCPFKSLWKQNPKLWPLWKILATQHRFVLTCC